MSVLADLAQRVVALRPGCRVRVAVDGGSCTGKTTLADTLGRSVAAERPVVRATVDRFHRPRAERYRRGPTSALGCYQDTYDLDALRRELLDPFAAGRPHRTGVWDWQRDCPVLSPPEHAPADAVLLLDGVFLQRPELRAVWDLVVLVVVPEPEVLRRAVVRDAAHIGGPEAVVERYRTRYLPAEALYAAESTRSATPTSWSGTRSPPRPSSCGRSPAPVPRRPWCRAAAGGAAPARAARRRDEQGVRHSCPAATKLLSPPRADP